MNQIICEQNQGGTHKGKTYSLPNNQTVPQNEPTWPVANILQLETKSKTHMFATLKNCTVETDS